MQPAYHEARSSSGARPMPHSNCRVCRCPKPLFHICEQCYDEESSRTGKRLSKLQAYAMTVRRKLHSLQEKVDFLRKWDAELFEPPIADFCLTGADGSFPVMAHRSILARQSPVFRAMLTSNMKEQSTGVVEIKDDCSSEGLKAFVHFIYTAEVGAESMETKWEELLGMAVKYNVKELENECVQHIVTKVVPKLPQAAECAAAGEEQFEEICETVVGLYRIGHKYGLHTVTEPIVRNMIGSTSAGVRSYHARFLSSRSYGALKQQSPGIALEICEFIASRANYIRCQTEFEVKDDPDKVLRDLARQEFQATSDLLPPINSSFPWFLYTELEM